MDRCQVSAPYSLSKTLRQSRMKPRRSAAARSEMLTDLLGNDSPRQRLAVLVMSLIFVTVAVAMAVVGRTRGPDVDAYVAAAGMTWAMCDLLIAFLLFVQYGVSRRLEFGIVAMAYALDGLLTFPYLSAYFQLFGTSAQTLGDQQLPAFFYLVWHAIFPIVVVSGYLFGSKVPRASNRGAASRVVTVLVVSAVMLTLATTIFGFAQRDMLPHFVFDGIIQPVYVALCLPIVLLLNFAGSVLLVTRRARLGSLQIWLALAMFTAFLGSVMTEISGVRYSYAWDYGKLMTLITASVVMGRILYDIVRTYGNLGRVLRLQTHQAASRMRAIWKMATSEGLGDTGYFQALLDISIANVRPMKSVFGAVSHLADGVIVIDAISQFGDLNVLGASARAYRPGGMFPMMSDVHSLFHAAGRTTVLTSPEIPAELRSSSVGWRSIIGTPIPVGAQTYFLVFGLLDPLDDDPFTEADAAFIEVVASNIGQRCYQTINLERLRYQIEHDALTGLQNRAQFLRLSRAALASRSLFAVALIDINHFRAVNEQFGQLVGDELLVEIASSLRGVDREDSVCRLSGVSFGVLMNLDASGRTLSERLETYEAVFRSPFHTGDGKGSIITPVSASLGAASLEPGVTFTELLHHANLALDHTKSAPLCSAITYSPAMTAAFEDLSLQRNEFIEAMELDQFRLEYQPTFELNARAIVGCEALIRWQHPSRGLQPPAAFLEAAKRAGVMTLLTTWVIRRIAKDLEGISVPRGFRCYFNVTAAVLEDDSFLVDLADILGTSKLLRTQLGIEVTESDLTGDLPRAIETLNAFRSMGLIVAIDDFGTGYSSLSYLKRLPIDCVKLDQSFTNGLPNGLSDVALAEMFLTLTRRFALISVAEGIETEEQAAWLRDHGCMIGQGFLLAPPLPFEQMARLIARGTGAPLAKAG
jgi:diguanylate cyclase (GGDEF)-like protein